MRRTRRFRIGAVAALLLLAGQLTSPTSATADASSGAVGAATCGPGSAPENGVQGEVPLVDRDSGRNTQGYSCNLSLVGHYQGEGASWVNPTYGHCAYLSSSFPSTLTAKHPGVSVVDVSDPAHPVLSATLTSASMLSGTWESLKVNQRRGLLAAVSGGAVVGTGFFDVYDISHDCAHPRLLNGILGTQLTLPVNLLGHEGSWSPDGNTYWATGLVGGAITAIDVSNPATPRTLFVGSTGLTNHGVSLSDDGNRLYVANLAPAGVTIFDSSSIQNRRPFPSLRQISAISWTDGLITQATVPVTFSGRPFLVAWDEFGSGSVRLIDIGDEQHPVATANIRLAINLPQNVDLRRVDTAGNGLFGYEAHYCTVNRENDPTALACGFFQSGIRVFDISDPTAVREIAYFNPPAQVGKRALLLNSDHANGIAASLAPVLSDLSNLDLGYPLLEVGPANLSADYCSSPPSFVGDELWVTCQDNGFLALRFTNGSYRPVP